MVLRALLGHVFGDALAGVLAQLFAQGFHVLGDELAHLVQAFLIHAQLCHELHDLLHGFAYLFELEGTLHAARHPFTIAQIIGLIEAHHLPEAFELFGRELLAAEQPFQHFPQALSVFLEGLGQHVGLFFGQVFHQVHEWGRLAAAEKEGEELLEGG